MNGMTQIPMDMRVHMTTFMQHHNRTVMRKVLMPNCINGQMPLNTVLAPLNQVNMMVVMVHFVYNKRLRETYGARY
jgi:hypothetical protein